MSPVKSFSPHAPRRAIAIIRRHTQAQRCHVEAQRREAAAPQVQRDLYVRHFFQVLRGKIDLRRRLCELVGRIQK
jgi:hypothetical protein